MHTSIYTVPAIVDVVVLLVIVQMVKELEQVPSVVNALEIISSYRITIFPRTLEKISRYILFSLMLRPCIWLF